MNKSTLRWLIIIATVITALIHLMLGLAGIFGGSPGGLDYIFVLNGLGFLILLSALFFFSVPVLSQNKRLTHILLILFAAVTFVLYFVFNGFGLGPAAIVSKLAEAVVMITAYLHMRQV